MRAARDSFLRFLADNLTDVDVHNIRTDPRSPDAQKLHNNAVNVQFLGDDPSVQVGMLVTSIDVVDEDELTAIDLTKKLWTVLSAAAYTALLDYTDPTTPVPLGGTVFWSSYDVRFRQVHDPMSFRYTCLLNLFYHE